VRAGPRAVTAGRGTERGGVHARHLLSRRAHSPILPVRARVDSRRVPSRGPCGHRARRMHRLPARHRGRADGPPLSATRMLRRIRAAPGAPGAPAGGPAGSALPEAVGRCRCDGGGNRDAALGRAVATDARADRSGWTRTGTPPARADPGISAPRLACLYPSDRLLGGTTGAPRAVGVLRPPPADAARSRDAPGDV